MIAVVALTVPLAGATATFDIEEAHTHLSESVYLVDAQIQVVFDEDELEALNSGIPLTMIIDMEVAESREYLWDSTVAELNSRQQLRLHALSGQYLLKNLNSSVARSYRTLEGALEALGTLKDFPLLDSHLLDTNEEYYLRLRARLDIEALPSPLRPIAYLRSLWGKKSEWKSWRIER